jgi:hypothetical protein
MQKLPSNRRRAVDADTNKRWSDSQKIEAVTTYLALGNLALTAKVLKIPDLTLRTWKQKTWWKEIEDELKVQDELQLSARLQRIIESTLSATEDRIKNGDWIYDNKTGGLVRKPVNLRDVHKVTMDMVDKREAILNKVVTAVPLEQIESKLEKLALKFEEIASKRSQQIAVTDVIFGEIDDAVHDEREKGLQERVPEVPLSSGADQESDGTDDGPETSGSGRIGVEG